MEARPSDAAASAATAPPRPGPSPERVRAVEELAALRRRELTRLIRAREPVRGVRARTALWSLAIVLLFAALRPGGVARAAGIEGRLLAGQGTIGGHRVTAPGERARAVPGDVLTAAAGSRLEVAVGAGRLTLLPGARLLVERLGPPSLRLLGGALDGLGPVRLQTPWGLLEAPDGVAVRVRPATGAAAGPDVGTQVPAGAPASASFWADGPGATLTDARGVHPVAVR